MIPLSLYIHFPWCVKKCPYCDFNSHALRGEVPEKQYIDVLIEDFKTHLPEIADRAITSVFMGGGTPSLFSPESIAYLLEEIKADDIEITLEANPGTIDQARFEGFRQAGVNRLSIGVQSFNDEHLKTLGRIHGREAAIKAIEAAHQAGFTNFNIDLMHGLPNQTAEQALADIELAALLSPAHLSWYELTLEPNTAFYRRPPQLPAEDTLSDIQAIGFSALHKHGFERYEISAYSKPESQCQHNLNYWRFGDYLGIGAGAHSKIGNKRFSNIRNPKTYMAEANKIETQQILTAEDKTTEFMMNALRLMEAIPIALFEERTGVEFKNVETRLRQAVEQGLLELSETNFRPTAKGYNYLNTLITMAA